MRKDYGIRDTATGVVIDTFFDPIEAKNYKQALPDSDRYEIVERSIENIYEVFPDNKVYITGVKETWKPCR